MKHNVYFEGKVQSLELSSPGGRATVGVMEPGTYTFPTSSEEHVFMVEGSMRVRLPGSDWQTVSRASGELVVPRGVSFDVEVQKDAAYICYYR